MARELKVGRKDMLDAVISIIEERGAAELSARAVAKKLGVSTQPIYREFSDMDGLRAAAAEYALGIYSSYVSGEAVDQALGYVRFARERGGLFNFLFRGKRYSYTGLDDLSKRLVPSTDIIERLEAITGLDEDKVYRLHLYIWMALNGLAAVAADSDLVLTDGELSDFTVELSKALSGYYKNTGTEESGQ